MIWYETLTCRYFNATKEEVENFMQPELSLGEVLYFLYKHDLKRAGYVYTLDPNKKVSIAMVDNKLIMTL